MFTEFSISFTKELYGIFLNEFEIPEVSLLIRDLKNKALYISLSKNQYPTFKKT